MAKSKFAPALFEVINTRQDAKDGGKLSVPKWWKSRTSEPEAAAAPQKASAEPPETVPVEVVKEAPAPPAAEVRPAPAPVVPPPPRPPSTSPRAVHEVVDVPPILKFESGRLALSLNPVSATVLGGVLLVALFTSYQLGHRFGSGEKATASAAGPRDEIDKLMDGPARPAVLNASTPPSRPRSKDSSGSKASNAGAAAAASAKPPSPPPEAPVPAARPVSPRYVVLETFRAGDKESAEFAKKWLATNKNLDTTVETRGDRIVLVSNDVFDFAKSSEEQRARQYLENIKALGKTISKEMTRAGVRNYVFSSPEIRSKQ